MLWCTATITTKEIDTYPPHGICVSLMRTVAGSHKKQNFSFSHCHEVLWWPSLLTCVRAGISCFYKWIADTFFEISYITAWAVCNWKPATYFCFTYTEEKEKETNTFWWKKLLKWWKNFWNGHSWVSSAENIWFLHSNNASSITSAVEWVPHTKESKTKEGSKTQGFTSYWKLLELHVKVTEGTKLLNLLF